MTKTRWGLFLILLLALALGLAACDTGDDDPDDVVVEQEGEVGEELEQAAEDIGDAAENVGDAVEDVAEDAADAVDDVAEDVDDAVDDAADAAADVGEDLDAAADDVAEDIDTAVDDAANTAADIGEDLDEAADDVGDAVAAAVDDVVSAVEAIDLPDVDLDINPWITVDDQFIENDQLTLSSVMVDEPGWITVRADDNGQPGPVLGYTRVDADTTDNVTIDLEDPAAVTGPVWLTLHEDTGEVDVFEFGEVDDTDMPVMIDNRAAVVRFWTEPHIRVQPQILVRGTNPPVTEEDATGPVTLFIHSVLTENPGFVVIHAAEGDSFGQVLGYAPVDAGLTTDLTVELDEAALTPVVWIMLHEDTGESSVFEFGEVEGEDVPVMLNGEPLTFPVPVGPAISPVAAWQDDDMLLVNWALIDQPGWLVLHQNNEGEPGEVVGSVELQAGLNVYLLVDVGAENVADTFIAMLHYDTDETGTFEFGDVEGADIPVMVDGAPVTQELTPIE